jgi:hypothetical protein
MPALGAGIHVFSAENEDVDGTQLGLARVAHY